MAFTRTDCRNEVRGNLTSWPIRSTTLNGAITAAATTFVATSASGIGANLLIEIDTETVLVLSVSGTTITILRGYHGTTAASHLDAATVNVYEPQGWTNNQINKALTKGIMYLRTAPYPLWTQEHYTFTWPANTPSVDIGSGVSMWPRGVGATGVVTRVAVKTSESPAAFEPFDNWQQRKSVIFKGKPFFSENKTVRLEIAEFQSDFASDSSSLNSDDYLLPTAFYATYWLLKGLHNSRVNYVKYSASLNERASTPDELLRTAFDSKNAADLARRDAYQPLPKRWSHWKGGRAVL